MITKCTKCGDEVERRHLLKKVVCFNCKRERNRLWHEIKAKEVKSKKAPNKRG